MEFGLYTFGDLTPAGLPGAVSAQQRIRDIIATAKLADDAGFDVFALGEHHRLDFAISATATMLAAIAQATRNIRLASAVTILPTQDPVTVFQEFATVDLISGGRAEIIAGRGVFTESFPLFGDDVADQDALFEEKIELLLKLRASERVTWKGRFRSPLNDAAIAPRPLQNPLPIWVGTGGTPESVARAGRLGLPLALANISKPPATLAPLAELYRNAGRDTGHAGKLPISIASHAFVRRDSQAAMDEFFPHYAAYARHHVPSQYKAREITRADYEQLAAPDGPLFVGSPQQLIDKILWERELFGHSRFVVQCDIGGVPFASVAQVIELLATDVIPAVRRAAGR